MSNLKKIKKLFKNINIIIEEDDNIFFGYQISNGFLKIATYIHDSTTEPEFILIKIEDIFKIKSTTKDKITIIKQNEIEISLTFPDYYIKKIIIELSAGLFNYNNKNIINSL